jgi:transcriptional regulator with XRE-family HTH domain
MKETIKVNGNELQMLVKEIRLAKGLTQQELATKMQTSRQNVYSMETGRHALGLQKIIKVVTLLGGKVEILVTV